MNDEANKKDNLPTRFEGRFEGTVNKIKDVAGVLMQASLSVEYIIFKVFTIASVCLAVWLVAGYEISKFAVSQRISFKPPRPEKPIDPEPTYEWVFVVMSVLSLALLLWLYSKKLRLRREMARIAQKNSTSSK